MATKEAVASDGGRNSEPNEGNGLSLSELAFVAQQPETSSAQGGEEQVQQGGLVKTIKSATKRKRKKKSKKKKNPDITAGNAKGNMNQSPPADKDAHLLEGRSSTEMPSIGDGREHSCEEPSGSSTSKREKEKENKGVTSLDCNSGDDYETAERDIASKHVAGMSSDISGDIIVKEPCDGQATRSPEKDGPQTDFIQEDNADSRQVVTMSKTDVEEDCDKEEHCMKDLNAENGGKELPESKPEDIADFPASDEQVKRSCQSADREGVRLTRDKDSNTLASGRLEETGDTGYTGLSDSEDNTNVEIHQEGFVA